MGDRVPYVIIQSHKHAKAYEKSEDPIYVLDNNIPIDTKYYLENQLMKPLLSIFEPVMGESKAKTLLGGDHTRKVVKVARSDGGLMKFAKKTAKCMGCKAVLRPQDGEKVLCTSCKRNESQLYQKEIAKLGVLEKRFSRLWSECQRCQGSLHQDVLCSNSDCPIFYMRKKVQTDMKSQDEIVQRFSLSW
jgi:DNA polymerase delta subunit 1